MKVITITVRVPRPRAEAPRAGAEAPAEAFRRQLLARTSTKELRRRLAQR